MRSLADGKTKVVLLKSAPADIDALKVSDITGGTDISCAIRKSDFRHGPTGSNTVTEAPLCVKGDPEVFTESNYGVTMTLFREFSNTTKQVDTEADKAFQAFSKKGKTAWIVVRDQTMKDSKEDIAKGDEVSIYEVMCDDPQNPYDRGGYIKKTIPLTVQRASVDQVLEPGDE